MERLNGLDASFLYLETPASHMHVCLVTVFDPATMPGGYSFDAIKRVVRSRLHLTPRLTRRLVDVPLQIHHPVWLEDPRFDLDYHVRRIGCPQPGGRRELAEVAAQIASVPLDRRRPLWEAWVVEGLKQDRFGIIVKMHHAAIDGISGSELMANMFDLEPIAAPEDNIPRLVRSEPIPSEVELVAHAIKSRVRRLSAAIPLLGRTAMSLTNLVQIRRDPDAESGATPLTAPRAPWNGAIGPQRRVALARVSLTDTKTIKNAHGCTVNDVVLATLAGAMRRFLTEHAELPETPLIAMCPVSVQSEDTQHQPNCLSVMFTDLATTVDDPLERLLAVSRSAEGAKNEHRALGPRLVAGWGEITAGRTFGIISRLYSSWHLANLHRPVYNQMISNVPGPPVPLYLAGAELVATYPMGPIMEGAGLNVTVMSYRDSIDFGFVADRDLMPNLWDLADAVKPAFAELLATVTTPTPRRNAPRRSSRSTSKSSATKPSNGSTEPVKLHVVPV